MSQNDPTLNYKFPEFGDFTHARSPSGKVHIYDKFYGKTFCGRTPNEFWGIGSHTEETCLLCRRSLRRKLLKEMKQK